MPIIILKNKYVVLALFVSTFLNKTLEKLFISIKLRVNFVFSGLKTL